MHQLRCRRRRRTLPPGARSTELEPNQIHARVALYFRFAAVLRSLPGKQLRVIIGRFPDGSHIRQIDEEIIAEHADAVGKHPCLLPS